MDYPKEQLWELYEELPDDLKKAIFSEEIADQLYNICNKNNIKDKGKIKEIVKHTGFVLLGVISPNEFPEILEKEIKLAKDTAKKISKDITNIVFFPLKKSLEAIYGIEIKGEKSVVSETTIKKESFKKDSYRELIE